MSLHVDVSTDMLDAVAEIHELAARAGAMLDDAEESSTWPDGLAPVLAALDVRADAFWTAYAPTENPDELQPVAFDDDRSGWDFDPWMHEKATRMRKWSERSASDWNEIAEAIASGDSTWSDYLAAFDRSDMGDGPVNRYAAFRYFFAEVERMARIIFEMLDEQLTATAPGRGWHLPTGPPGSQRSERSDEPSR